MVEVINNLLVKHLKRVAETVLSPYTNLRVKIIKEFYDKRRSNTLITLMKFGLGICEVRFLSCLLFEEKEHFKLQLHGL